MLCLLVLFFFLFFPVGRHPSAPPHLRHSSGNCPYLYTLLIQSSYPTPAASTQSPMTNLEDSKAQLYAISAAQNGDPVDLYYCTSSLAISLVMGVERYLRHFDSATAIPLLLNVAEGRVNDVNNGDVMVMTFRCISLIFEHVPSSYDAAKPYHKSLVAVASTALHLSLCGEWRYKEVDTASHIEECLRVLRFVSKDDRTGTVMQLAFMGDILTLCAHEDSLIARQALETLSVMCSKVIMPSEFQKPSFSSGFLKLFKSSKNKHQDAGIMQSDNATVDNVENVVTPFLLSLAEQHASELQQGPEAWLLLEVALQCIGTLMERAFLCHRPSTAKVIASKELPALMFHIISVLEGNMALEEATRTERLLFCESMLAVITTCNQPVMVDAMLLPDATKFFHSVLGNSTKGEITTLLDDPFPKATIATRSTQYRDKDHITSIGAIRLLVLVCPNVPPEAFGLKPKVIQPIHQWLWENDLRHNNRFIEEQCVVLENSWQTLSRGSSVSVNLKTLAVDLQTMTMARGFSGGHRNISRSFVPFVYHLVDETLVRPVVAGVKDAGSSPAEHGSAKRGSSSKRSLHCTNRPHSSIIMNNTCFVVDSHMAIAEQYFVDLCEYATSASGQLAKQLAMSACASVLQLVFLSESKHRVVHVLESAMSPLCEMFREALVSTDKATKAVILTMVQWMLHHDLSPVISFCEASLRCGLLSQLQSLSQVTPSASISRDAKLTRTADLADRAALLHNEIEQKLMEVHSCGAANDMFSSPETAKLKRAVDGLANVATSTGVCEPQFRELFQALQQSEKVTPFEIYEMGIASSILVFLLGGKTVNEVLGESLTFTSGASGSTFTASTTNRFLSATVEVQQSPSSAMIARGMRVGDLLDVHMSAARVECLKTLGHEFPTALKILIEHLVATLPLKNALPLVESLLSHEKVVCATPVQAFQALSDISPRVVLCGQAGTVASPSTQPNRSTAPVWSELRDLSSPIENGLVLQSHAPPGDHLREPTPELAPKQFCMRGHKLKYTPLYPTRCSCDLCKKRLRSGFGCRVCNYDMCKDCNLSYEGNAPLIKMLLTADTLPGNRGHLVATVGDIERFFRTGSTSTKATQLAPTSQSYLHRLDHFVTRAETFLRRQIPSATPETAKVIHALLQSPRLLRKRMHTVLASFYTRGELPGDPFPSGVDSSPSKPLDNFTEKQALLVDELLREAVEDRYILYRPTGGRLPYQDTFLSTVYQRALATDNSQVLLQLENCLLRLESSQEQLSLQPKTASSSTVPIPVASTGLEGGRLSETIDRIEEFTGNKISADQTFVFHYFEGDCENSCSCGAYRRTDFSAHEFHAKGFALPDFGRRADTLLLIYLHKCFYSVFDNIPSVCPEETCIRRSNLPPPSIFINSSITTMVVKSLGASALRVSLLPPKFALPRWVNFILTDARFLLPLPVRDGMCRFLAYSARRSLNKHMQLFRQHRFDRTVSVIPGEWARMSNHKFSVRRDHLLHDAHTVLRKSAESRFPISIEFTGDAGVGQGPTAQFYTLVAQELSRARLHLWRDATVEATEYEPSSDLTSPSPVTPPLYPKSSPPRGALRSHSGSLPRVSATAKCTALQTSEHLVVPPTEGLFPRRWQPEGTSGGGFPLPPALSPRPDRGRSVSSYSSANTSMASVSSVTRRTSISGKIILTDLHAVLQDYVETARETAKAFYLVGAAMGRAFVDEQVLPLALSSALAIFMRRGIPAFQLTLDPILKVDDSVEVPFDLLDLPVRTVGLVDATVAKSLEVLETMDAATLEALEIPFTLLGDDSFELIPNGANIFVTKDNVRRYQRRVVDALLYESVALPMRLITSGCRDVLSHEALTVLEFDELMRILCGEQRAASVPLWTSAEVRSVLVGDHGYQNDSPQISMLVNILSKRFTPAEQRAFLLFCTGCPRFPLGGIRALGAITVVKRSNAFFDAPNIEIGQLCSDDEDGVDVAVDQTPPSDSKCYSHEEHFRSCTSSSSQDGVQAPTEDATARNDQKDEGILDADWALPTVNTCFRYLKLPPYPTEDLMYHKLLLSITGCGDTFELS